MQDSAPRPSTRDPLPLPRLLVLCEVVLESDLFGSGGVLIRNLTASGAFLETRDFLPLGTLVRIHFGQDPATIVAHAVVQQHHTHNYADAQGPNALAGMVVRFVSFEAGERQLSPQFH